MDAALFESAFDLLRRDQRASGVVHGNVFRSPLRAIQACANRILPAFAAGDNRAKFFETGVPVNFLNLIVPIFACHDDNFGDRKRPIECADCVCDDRFARNRGKQFIESHTLTAAGSDENSGKHG